MSHRLSQTRPAVVVGAGIVGLASALELQSRGYRVTIYDQHIPTAMRQARNISVAAGAQFLPYTHRDIAISVERYIHTLALHSRPVYERLAENPALTGVVKLTNVELVHTRESWSPALTKLMRTSLKPLARPLVLTASSGPPRVYDAYYEFDTFSINTPKLLQYLRVQFCLAGGEMLSRRLDLAALHSLGVPTIQAMGAGVLGLIPDAGVVLRKGISLVFRPAIAIPSVAVSVDDLLIMPREDGTVVIGVLYMDKPSSNAPEPVEIHLLLQQARQLAAQAAGGFGPLDMALFAGPYESRAGQRVVHPGGPQICRDLRYPWLVHNYAHESVGWTTAFGAASIAVDLL